MVELKEEIMDWEMLDEIEPLAEVHIKEVSIFSVGMDIHRMMYIKAQEANVYKLLTARKDGKLVGYIGFFIFRHPHYDLMTAQQDILYMHPDYRGVSSVKMIKKAEKMCIDSGCELILQHVKKEKHAKLFKHLGYKQCDYIMANEV